MSPQLENGYLRIATELIDKVFCKGGFSGQERQVLWFIIRKTWGWGKKSDKISYSQIAISTGISRRNAIKIINKLVAIGSVKKTTTTPITLSFIKDYNKWKLVSKRPHSVQEHTTLVSRKTPKVVSCSTPTIDNKDTLTIDTILSQSKALLTSFPNSIQNLIRDYIELAKQENKTHKITPYKELRLLNELAGVQTQSEEGRFEKALKITVDNQVPNVNYLKKVYKGLDKRQKVYQDNQAKQNQEDWNKGTQLGKQKVQATQEMLKKYERA